MTDRVYPSAKPPATAAANGGAPVANGTAAANGTAHPPAANKPQLYRPYRPQPASHRRRHRRRCRCTLCCCCFWAILLFLMLALLIATAGAALYVLYRPHKPEFSILSLRTGALNLTTDQSASSSRLTTSFNLTLSSKNPNSHYFTFFYDPFAVTFLSSSGVPVGNSSIPAFVSSPKNQTVFKSVIVSATAEDLDTDAVKSLQSDLKRANGISLKIQLDTKVKVKAGKLKSERIGIRVVCDGIKGVAAPKGKTPAVAAVADAHCKVDLRIKIWKFTF